MASSGVKLTSKDGKTFEIPAEAARLSAVVQSLREDVGEHEAIPCPNTEGDVLATVVAYLVHHKDDEVAPPGEPEEYRTDDVSVWDQSLMSPLSRDQVFQVMLAANYLDISPLLHMCCKVMANSLRGFSPEEVARALGSEPVTWTQEEEDAMRRENPWLSDV